MILTKVTLSADEALAAVNVGAMRQLRVVHAERKTDHGGRSWRRQRDRWANQIHGAMAEIAFSRAINRAWTPGGRAITNGGDVGKKIEVRATEMNNDETCMYVYKKDADHLWCVIAIGHYPTFEFCGGLLAGEGKRKEWWREDAYPPCWYVPRQVLIPLADIPNLADLWTPGETDEL